MMSVKWQTSLKSFLVLSLFIATTSFANVCGQAAADGSYKCCDVNSASAQCCDFDYSGSVMECGSTMKSKIMLNFAPDPQPKPAPKPGCRWGSSSTGRCCPGRMPHDC
jgi:hypothetical protein